MSVQTPCLWLARIVRETFLVCPSKFHPPPRMPTPFVYFAVNAIFQRILRSLHSDSRKHYSFSSSYYLEPFTIWHTIILCRLNWEKEENKPINLLREKKKIFTIFGHMGKEEGWLQIGFFSVCMMAEFKYPVIWLQLLVLMKNSCKKTLEKAPLLFPSPIFPCLR